MWLLLSVFVGSGCMFGVLKAAGNRATERGKRHLNGFTEDFCYDFCKADDECQAYEFYSNGTLEQRYRLGGLCF